MATLVSQIVEHIEISEHLTKFAGKLIARPKIARADQGSVKGIAYFYLGNGKGVAYFFKTHQANSNSL